MPQKSTTPAVVTRFAPSPTGFLHIGGARTALFNWLYARHTGGRYVLRIEDTDRERSSEAAIAAIIDGLAWLGLEADEAPVFQFARAERHRAVVEELLARGRAYRCYATPAELEEMRAQAEAAGRSPTYDGRWRDRDPADAPAGVAPAIRLRAEQDGETVIEDQVQGRVVFQNANLDDLIILRSDGTPTYNLAVVVDDHDMGITHVIRGVDHLTNAARQTQIYRALDWDVPVFAHVPLIHGPDGAKLSKRHGALGVEAYREMGYLPEALRNYLVRLGWSHGDDEIFTQEQMVAWFDFDGLGKSPARFDFTKLADVNAHFLRAMPADDLLAAVKDLLPLLPGGGEKAAAFDRIGWDRFEVSLPGLKERAKTLIELIDAAGYLIAQRPLAIDDKAGKHLDPAARQTLAKLHERLKSLPEWSIASIEQAVREFCADTGLKLGKVGPPLRAALTGTMTSPPIFDVAAALGRDEALARISDQAS
ncbi:MAG: glutamate--tRNA ligase [Hyphomicrobiaceae bacterium]|nr:glutamate--tRNA ligase [Hyphomicrobiaceae bacterium]